MPWELGVALFLHPGRAACALMGARANRQAESRCMGQGGLLSPWQGLQVGCQGGTGLAKLHLSHANRVLSSGPTALGCLLRTAATRMVVR